jgi:hypothetical protein
MTASIDVNRLVNIVTMRLPRIQTSPSSNADVGTVVTVKAYRLPPLRSPPPNLENIRMPRPFPATSLHNLFL